MAYDKDIPIIVRLVLILAVISIAIGLVNTIREFPTSATAVSPAMLIGSALVMTGLWVGVIYLIACRRNWARWLFIVVAFLALPGAVFSFEALPGTDIITAGVSLSQHGANIVAAVLLLLPTSSRWFCAERKDQAVDKRCS